MSGGLILQQRVVLMLDDNPHILKILLAVIA